MEMLNKDYHLNLDLDEIVELEEAQVDNEDSFQSSNNSRLCLRPLQLAIVTAQEEVIEAILRHIITSNDSDGIMELLEIHLGHQASITFPESSDPWTFDKDDRSLDGMNAFHLAAKYYPAGLKLIFDVLNDNNATYSNLLELLLKKDRHLQQTPLHVALKHRGSDSTEAARYRYLFYYLST